MDEIEQIPEIVGDDVRGLTYSKNAKLETPHVVSYNFSNPPAVWTLEPREVHVWEFPLQVTPATLADFGSTLAPAERERAARFHFERDRNRFIAGRAQMRYILSEYLRTKPSRVQFCYSARGKPALNGEFAGSGLEFNLAHSDDLAILAVTRAGKVGVDVERVRPLKDVGDLVARFFSQRENDLFQQLLEEQKSAAFFNLWTRKEAWLKATGEGIGELLNQVEVSFLPGEAARILHLPTIANAVAHWDLHALAPASGFIGAMATATPGTAVQCWKWKGLQ
jgi:4'-phosphopantetheinyl transferase